MRTEWEKIHQYNIKKSRKAYSTSFFPFQLDGWTHVPTSLHFMLRIVTTYQFCGCGEGWLKKQGYVRDYVSEE
jgi:hypothetical protein